MNKQYTAVIDTTSYLGNALNYLGGPDDNQMKNQDLQMLAMYLALFKEYGNANNN